MTKDVVFKIRFLSVIFVILVFSSCTSTLSREESAQLYFNLGNAQFELEKYREAEASYKRALELDDTFLPVNYNLARLLIQVDRTDEAIDLLYDLLADDHTNVVVLETLAWAYHLKGNDSEALGLYDKILEETPAYENALYNAGLISLQNDDKDSALSYFRSLYDYTGKQGIIYYYLGMLELDIGDLDTGVRFLESYIEEVKPEDHPDALVTLGTGYQHQTYYDKAIEVYDQALEIDSDSQDHLLTDDDLGMVYLSKAYIYLDAVEDYESGFDNIKKAVNLKYVNAELYSSLLALEQVQSSEEILSYLEERGIIDDEQNLVFDFPGFESEEGETTQEDIDPASREEQPIDESPGV